MNKLTLPPFSPDVPFLPYLPFSPHDPFHPKTFSPYLPFYPSSPFLPFFRFHGLATLIFNFGLTNLGTKTSAQSRPQSTRTTRGAGDLLDFDRDRPGHRHLLGDFVGHRPEAEAEGG